MVAEEMGMVNFSPITSEWGGQVLDYQKQTKCGLLATTPFTSTI
jgi:hypothetical protein